MGMVQKLTSFKGSKAMSLSDSVLYLVVASLFGFLSLLCATSFLARINWYQKEGFGLILGFQLHYDEYYNLLVLLILILGLSSVRRLSRRCHDPLFSLIQNGFMRSDGGGSNLKMKMQSLKMKLRRERKKRNEAMAELEREREASAWASEEAMAKIMVLEREKARVEREARQYRQMVEEKQLHDEEVIHHLLLHLKSLWMEMEKNRGDGDDAFWCVGSDVDCGPKNLHQDSCKLIN